MSTALDAGKRYLIQYPSGSSFVSQGKFNLTPLESWLLPVVVLDSGKAVILDQRAIVSCDGDIVYSPRRNRDGLQPDMSKWINEHPEWDI